MSTEKADDSFATPTMIEHLRRQTIILTGVRT